ncbi:MAG: DUF4440 domain-containing protein [Acetobacteraceae bacterium]|nr:DUF4440 domain-containing protein [Acetobacteraceae bacterium]MBV8592328.1 DUF4440 domain-containing protein [Acetobacteraceae bacterium]
MTTDRIASARRLFIPVVALGALMALPALAQQTSPRAQMPSVSPQSGESYQQTTGQDQLRTVATSINAKRGELIRKKDAAGVAAMYLPDATYVELLPKLQVMLGRAQIQQHFQELIAAGVGDAVYTVTEARTIPSGAVEVGGDYYLNVRGGKRISGHFYQVLRQDGGNWKIAMHVFARPEPVTAVESRQYNMSGGAQ